MKLTIEIPDSIASLIRSPVDEDFLIQIIKKSIEGYVYETPRLVKNQNATPVLIMSALIESEMRVEK